jgi:catechol 2,3-dioxygenase-like lactoylglutathione lyase family enzyme
LAAKLYYWVSRKDKDWHAPTAQLKTVRQKLFGIKMKPSLSYITLGVRDLDKSIHFYHEGLGFPLEYRSEQVAFFSLEGCQLALFPKEALFREARIDDDEGGTPPISLVQKAESRAEVEAILEQAKAAGAVVTREPSETCYGGYSGYFSDPDGYLWEIVWESIGQED